jgi:hypothetical protein
MSLLIPVLRENYASLEAALDTFAPFDWAVRGSIHLIPIDEPRRDLNGLFKYCQDNDIEHILVTKRLHSYERPLSEAGYTVLTGPGIKELIQGHALRDKLRMLHLDWQGHVMARLANYGLGPLCENGINSWLAQFQRLGNHRAVGEHLLQLLDVMSLAELGDSLCGDSDFYGVDLVIGFNNDSWGKSGATVSNLIRKKCVSAKLLPVTEAIQAGEHPKVLRLVEDGLFSGTEIRAIFESLRGTRPPDRTQKVPMLPDPSKLSKFPIRLHFGVVCDFGEAILREYMAANSLPNVQVVVAAAKKIRVLYGAPTLSLSNDVAENGPQDQKTFRDRLVSRVVPFAFQDDKGWKSSASRLRAMTFCENIGEQLWRNYIDRKIAEKKFNSAAWPEERIRLCALGMQGLGLTFAFPHSVPKATLPLFWARGPVTLGETSLDWIPLFPNADT